METLQVSLLLVPEEVLLPLGFHVGRMSSASRHSWKVTRARGLGGVESCTFCLYLFFDSCTLYP